MSDTTPIGANNKRALVKWYDPFKTIHAAFTRSRIEKLSFDQIIEKGMFKFSCSPIPVICRGLHRPIESLVTPNNFS